MKKKGLKDETLKNNRKLLIYLSKHVDLRKPEDVKGYIATLEKADSYKRNLSLAYWNYAKSNGLSWEKPKYYQTSRLPNIPSDEKINMIIANSPKKLALALSMSRDTGMRPVELMGLRLSDVDIENGVVHPFTAKHGAGRVLKVRTTTINLLSSFLSKHPETKPQDRIFGGWTSEYYGKYFRWHRNALAAKLSDPSIKTVKLYSLRHAFAMKLYNQTRNILLVKQQFGHRRIETTLTYTQLVSSSDEFVCEITSTLNEFTQLLESGFEYVSDYEGKKILRKRK
jgi:integrase